MGDFLNFLREDVSKLPKSTVLYFTSKDIGNDNGARCNICRFFKDDKCDIVIGDIDGPKGICGLYVYGNHVGELLKPNLSKVSSSYSEQGPTHCGNCIAYGDNKDKTGPCKSVEGVVEFHGCCNSWSPKK